MRPLILRKIVRFICVGTVLVVFASISTAESKQNDFIKYLTDYGGLAEETLSGLKKDDIAKLDLHSTEIRVVTLQDQGHLLFQDPWHSASLIF